MKSSLQILTILVGLIHPIAAQLGNLDSTFNINGRVTTDFITNWAQANSGSLQSDGKIIAAGVIGNGNNSYFGITRYHPNGSLDTTFGIDGKAIIQVGSLKRDYANAMVIQADNKILVAGTSQHDTNNHIAILRLQPHGEIDSAFGTHGVTILALEGRGNNGTAIAIQHDGKIVLAGYTSYPNKDALLLRFTANGIPDSSFGTFGKIVTDIPFYSNDANTIAVQHDGKIVIGGLVGFVNSPIFDFSLIRYHENGSLDSTFGEHGIVRTSISQWDDQLNALAIQSDGKIIAAGNTNSGDPNLFDYDFVVARYNEDGVLDMDFGVEGVSITPFGAQIDVANAVAIQSDGKIVVVGTTNSAFVIDFAIARFHPDGSLDTGWGIGGKLTTDFNSSNDGASDVAIQPDGKIIAFGYENNGEPSDFALARYFPSLSIGVLDFSVVHDVLIYPNPIQENVALEYTLLNNETLTIEVLDISGRPIQLLASGVSKLRGTHKESYQLRTDILPGIYVVYISNEYGSISIKTIKE